MRFFLFFVSSLIVISPCYAQQISADEAAPSNEVTLLFAGDAMQHSAQFNSAFNPKTKQYDYSSNFTHLEPIIKQADIAVVNLETTLGGKPYKAFPQFSSPDSFAKQLQTSGFDIFMLANNHSNDSWLRGVKRTIQTLDKMGIIHSGTYQSKKEHDQTSPLMIKKNGLTLAFLNYTFATNGIESVFKEQTKLVSFKQMRRDIKQAKINKADSIIVYIHWGDEYKLEPSQYQKDVAKFLIDSKVDLIIGSHPHVVQPMIWQKEKNGKDEYLLAYSLGNFISNQRDLQQSGGALLQVTLKKQEVMIENKDDIGEIGEKTKGKTETKEPTQALKTKTVTKIDSAGFYLSFVDRTQVGDIYQYQVLPVRKFETQVDSINWQQYGILLRYALWAGDFLNTQNINVPEYRFKNNQWELDKTNQNKNNAAPVKEENHD